MISFAFLLGLPLLVAQPNPVSTTPFPFTSERFIRNGEFFRAFQSDFEENHSWSSSERLMRSDAAIYADLRHAALQELAELREDRVNQNYAATASLRIGLITLKKEDYGRARLNFNDAVATGEETSDISLGYIAGEALFWIGASHLMESGRGGYAQAISSFKASISSFPANPRADDALYFLGQLAEARDDFEDALLFYGDLLEQYPHSDYRVAAAIRRTQLLNMLHRFDEAMNELEVAETMWSWYKAEKSETSQRYHQKVDLELVLLRGEISIGRNDLPGAERAWLTLLYELDGGYRRAGMLGLAETYRVAGLTDSAVSLYSRIIEEKRDDSPGMQAEYFLAIALIGSPNTSDQAKEEAQGVLQEIAEAEDHTMRDQALLTLGDLAYREGDFVQSVAFCREVIERSPSRRIKARAEALSGGANLQLHRFDASARAFAQAEEIAASISDRDMPEREYLMDLSGRMRGVALMWGERYDEAVAAFNVWLRDYSDTALIPTVLWLRGETEFAAERYGEAVRTMEGIVEDWLESDRVEPALYTIGWSQLRMNNLPKAESAFARLVKAYPLSEFAAQSQIRRGDCFYLQKNFGTAADIYGTVETMNPTPEEAQYAAYQKAMAVWQAGDTISARRNFSIFVANNGGSEWGDDALFMSGLLDYRAGDFEGAIKIMRTLLDTYADSRLHARAYYTIGDSYYRMRKFDEAVAAYSIVTERFPESTYMKDAETGIVYARAALEKVNDRSQLDAVQVNEIGGRPSYELELRRAQIFLDANRIEDAEKEYQSFIANNPESGNLPVAWLGLADCALLRSDTAAAIDTLATLVRTFNEGHVVPAAALRLVDLHLSESDTVSAIETLANLRAKFSESAAASTALIKEAELLLTTGRRQDAKTVLREGVASLDSISGHQTRSGGRILSLIAELEIADGEVDSARSRWQLLAERTDSLAANALLDLADSYTTTKETAQAIEAYQSLLKRISSDSGLRAQAELGLARAYEASGDINKALELYRAIIERHGDDPYSKEAERRLQEIEDL
ncbi:MAG: tetratricopeptide repeat protein [Candidatus Kapaibacterium sp.]